MAHGDLIKLAVRRKVFSPATILVILGLFSGFGFRVFAVRHVEQTGFSDSYPVRFSDWGNAFPAGNGKMGILVFGNPLNETVIFNDRNFFLAASSERTFNQVSPENLELIRTYCAEGKWVEANNLANKVHGWKDGGEGNKHPGFEMLIAIPEDGVIRNYSRNCNFRTGEISVKWTDNRGNWERTSFVSRKDNVVVQYLKAPDKGTLSCSIRLAVDSGMNFPHGMAFSTFASSGYLNFRAHYPENTNGAGYEGVVRVLTSGGTETVEGNILKISNARSVTLLTRTARYFSDCENEWNQQKLQKQLALVPAAYPVLLKGQQATHQLIYDRVKLDLDAPAADRTLTNEALLAKQKKSEIAVTALWERIFDAGRYYYLSSSSDQAPPDLLGIWTGDCNVGWSGFYHLDANLNLQVAGGNIGDMPEAMEGYFNLMDRLKDGFEINASKLLGCRGLLGGGNTAGRNGLISALNFYYPYQYVTGEMGWLLYPFWEHYLVTGDTLFLRNRLYPLLKEMGYFYEDFLKKTDSNGNYIFAGSISPENQPAGLQLSLVNNSGFDIAGARFCLSTLLQTCKILGLGEEQGAEITKWTVLLDKLPPYLINGDGALQEWSWPGLKDNYNHRHSSHLIAVWPYHEIGPEKDSTLFAAALKTLTQKDNYNYENAGHGLLHAALIAAGLKNSFSLERKLLRLSREDYYYNSLCSSHYNGHGVFCTDVCNTVPAIMMEMLVSSGPGELELLPALPAALAKGSVSGIKGRNRVTVENLSWDMNRKLVSCILKSDTDQKITLIERTGIGSIKTNAKVESSPLGIMARVIHLKKGEPVFLSVQLQ